MNIIHSQRSNDPTFPKSHRELNLLNSYIGKLAPILQNPIFIFKPLFFVLYFSSFFPVNQTLGVRLIHGLIIESNLI